MCGRFAFEPRKNLSSRFKIKLVIGSLHENYNISPGQTIPVVIKAETGNEIVDMKWGLQMSIPKPGQKPFAPFNARSETVVEKAFFRRFLGNRCIIPAIGFYEWQKKGSAKQPFFIHKRSEDYLSLAGIYNTIKDKDGKDIHTVTILTTDANSVLEPIHDRMPVIIKPEDEEKWLSSNNLDEFVPLMKPYNPEEMEAYPINKFKSGINDRTLINPL